MFYFIENYLLKNVVLNICLFDNLANHSLQEKQNRVSTNAGVYRYTVKCARGSKASQHTTESNIQTPWQSLSNVFVLDSIVVVRLSKNKASVTPFKKKCSTHRLLSHALREPFNGQMQVQRY